VVGVVLYLVFLAAARRMLAKAGRDTASLGDRMRWRNRIVLPASWCSERRGARCRPFSTRPFSWWSTPF
jgi:hypothetical protein